MGLAWGELINIKSKSKKILRVKKWLLRAAVATLANKIQIENVLRSYSFHKHYLSNSNILVL